MTICTVGEAGGIYLAAIRTSLMLLAAVLPVAAQADFVEFGQLSMVKAHATWPAPEAIVRDLRSPSEDVRLRVLTLTGVPEKLQRNLNGVVRPTQIELRYAAFGGDEVQQAVLGVEVGQYGFAAVATPRGNGWERVAAFDCWCKYDRSHFLDEFLQITSAPEPNVERFELVLRASGGGSGLYNQDEVHFRFYRGEMKPVMHFVARKLSWHEGIPKPFLEIERRWFHVDTYSQGAAGGENVLGVLVEGRADLQPNSFPPIEVGVYERSVRDLESRHLGRLKCQTYEWNEKTFHYDPFAGTNPCRGPQP